MHRIRKLFGEFDDPNSHIIAKQTTVIKRETINQIVSSFAGRKIKINDYDLFRKAFVHTSFAECYRRGLYTDPEMNQDEKMNINSIMNYYSQFDPMKIPTYEVLEYVGDLCINFTVGMYVYDRYPDQNQGFYTTSKIKLNRGVTLAKLSRLLNFDKYVLMSKFIYLLDDETKSSVYEDVFESFCGALKLDQGMEIVHDFIIGLINTSFNIDKLISVDDNYKNQLIPLFDKLGWGYPVYDFISAEKLENGTNLVFSGIKVTRDMVESGVKFETTFIYSTKTEQEEEFFTVGTGKNKITAEQEAARTAVEKIQVSKH